MPENADTRPTISKRDLDGAMSAYSGPSTSASDFINWMLRRFAEGRFSAMEANCSPDFIRFEREETADERADRPDRAETLEEVTE